jgi:hypothetical protein
MKFFTGVKRAVTRNTVICQMDLGIQNVFCHKNLERCNSKYCNRSDEFSNTERSLSQEFRQL